MSEDIKSGAVLFKYLVEVLDASTKCVDFEFLIFRITEKRNLINSLVDSDKFEAVVEKHALELLITYRIGYGLLYLESTESEKISFLKNSFYLDIDIILTANKNLIKSCSLGELYSINDLSRNSLVYAKELMKVLLIKPKSTFDNNSKIVKAFIKHEENHDPEYYQNYYLYSVFENNRHRYSSREDFGTLNEVLSESLKKIALTRKTEKYSPIGGRFPDFTSLAMASVFQQRIN